MNNPTIHSACLTRAPSPFQDFSIGVLTFSYRFHGRLVVAVLWHRNRAILTMRNVFVRGFSVDLTYFNLPDISLWPIIYEETMDNSWDRQVGITSDRGRASLISRHPCLRGMVRSRGWILRSHKHNIFSRMFNMIYLDWWIAWSIVYNQEYILLNKKATE